jgi:hypothetical protein
VVTKKARELLRWLGLTGEEEYAEEVEEVIEEFDPDVDYFFSEESFFEDDWLWIAFFWALWERMQQKQECWEIVDKLRSIFEKDDGSFKNFKKTLRL